MATSGSVSTNTTYDSYFWVTWQRSNYDIAGNYSIINWQCGVYCGHNFYSNAIRMSAVTINGTQVYGGGTYSNYNKGNHEIASGSLTIYHNTDGNKTLTVSSFTGWLYSGYNYSSNGGSWELPTIPRYANITSFSVSKKDETSVTVSWGADALCDKVWCSTNNGSTWIEKSGTSFIISGLTANTTYNFKIKVRRKDSQLETTSNTYSQTTYNYPYITSTPNFTIGNSITIGIYNPLGRSCTIFMKNPAGTEYGGDVITGQSASGYYNNNWKAFWYAGIPNSKSGTYKVRLVCSALSRDTTVNGGTYYCNDNECKPTYTATNISYFDSNTTVTTITTDNQHIVQNKSNLKVTCSGANAKNSASIISYRAVFNGVTKTGTGNLDFGTVNVSSSASVSVTAIDSRGYETTATKQITILPYSSPTAILTAYRKNNYEDENYFKCDATISSVNGKNTMTIKYGYAQGASSSPSATTNISDNTLVTNSLDKRYEYRFIATVQDKFESKNFYIVLPKGVMIEFWDTQKLSVGINGFPIHDKSFEVFGDLYYNNKKVVTESMNINNNDLNTIKDQTAFYYCNSCTNSPIETNGFLFVHKVNDNYVMQVYITIWNATYSRVCNNGTWYSWVKHSYLGIAESGSNENGNYVKYDDGTMICSVRFSGKDIETTNYGSLFLANKTWNYPVQFIDVPKVTCSEFQFATGASWGTVGGVYASLCTLRGIDIVHRPLGTQYNISAIAIGKWK